MSENKIAVLGAGTMGSGIAQVAAQNGFDVLLYDVKDDYVQRGLSNIKESLVRRGLQGKLDQDEMQAIIRRIKSTTKRDDCAAYPLVVEAAPEDFELKREIFEALSAKAAVSTILASNTSSLSITAIGAACKMPERVVGMHFFNPAPAMPLVEVIAGRKTAPEVVETVSNVARAMGKTVVRAADMPGFIVNRVARPFYSEALKIVGEGSATISHVDAAMTAAGFRMGPFELMDLIGIDINFAVTKSVFEAFFYESRYRPHPIQQRMVEAGTLGRKTGSGFYDYGKEGKKAEAMLHSLAPMLHKRQPFIPVEVTSAFLRKAGVTLPSELQGYGEVVVRILAMLANEGAFAVGEGVASVRDVDIAMRLGTNYPQGPLKWADMIGLDLVFNALQALQASLGEDRYRPAPLLWHLAMSGAIGDAVGSGFHTPGEKGMV